LPSKNHPAGTASKSRFTAAGRIDETAVACNPTADDRHSEWLVATGALGYLVAHSLLACHSPWPFLVALAEAALSGALEGLAIDARLGWM
jgi:hypothetical protein